MMLSLNKAQQLAAHVTHRLSLSFEIEICYKIHLSRKFFITTPEERAMQRGRVR